MLRESLTPAAQAGSSAGSLAKQRSRMPHDGRTSRPPTEALSEAQSAALGQHGWAGSVQRQPAGGGCAAGAAEPPPAVSA